MVSIATVLLVEDHPLARAGATAALEEAGFTVLACASALDALRAASEESYDAALVDLDLPDRPGLWLIRQLHESNPQLPVAALSASLEERLVVEVLDAGAVGYLTKAIDLPLLAAKVHQMLLGDEVFDDLAASRLIGALRARPRGRSKLSVRELQVLQFLATGAGTSEIAAELLVSPNTVKDVVRLVFQKLGVNTRAEAVAVGFRTGLLS
jgi:DNA-binding NarL/FixJ family response regulator